jgi:hypothetical protein
MNEINGVRRTDQIAPAPRPFEIEGGLVKGTITAIC